MSDLLKNAFDIHASASSSRVGEETVILHLDSGIYFSLDEMGTRVWQGLADGQAPLAICEQVAREFDEPQERVEEDVGAFLESLLDAELIVAAPRS